jgi:cell division septum initiation protein DivIVA
LFSYGGVRRGDDDGSTDGLTAHRLASVITSVDSSAAAPTMRQSLGNSRTNSVAPLSLQAALANAHGGSVLADPAEAATGAADEIAKSALAVAVASATKNEGRGTAEVVGADAAGSGSAAGVLALAQKLHDQYVSEGQNTRERLISEGQSRHDQVVGEATARHEELLTTGQASYDEFVSVGKAKHDALVAEAEALIFRATAEHEHMITEARERSTGMVTEAQQKKADVLQGLGTERRSVQKEIEELQAFERNHRAHLKSFLQGQLIELEQTEADQTG